MGIHPKSDKLPPQVGFLDMTQNSGRMEKKIVHDVELALRHRTKLCQSQSSPIAISLEASAKLLP